MKNPFQGEYAIALGKNLFQWECAMALERNLSKEIVQLHYREPFSMENV
jgi:hypothetical protein